MDRLARDGCLSRCRRKTTGDQGFRRAVPRREAFFGLHFDLHPRAQDTSLGADTSEENIAQLLTRVRPDYVQYDCKGHPGYGGYPTKVGWASPGVVRDALAVWRKVTREHGVGLCVHYSGIWDECAVARHPEWARVDRDGGRDARLTSPFGPYVDELLIPQLKEVVAAYDIDGIWVDADCWAAAVDYSEAALSAWLAETGETGAPRAKTDPLWQEWKAFHRRQTEAYLGRWVDALHEFDPRLQLASNGMYATFAPKRPAVKLDFLSYDLPGTESVDQSPSASVDRARTEARYLASTGLPWDLMSWGFTADGNLKRVGHLCQEAGAVLMQGGGYEIYYYLAKRSGHIDQEIIETAAQVAGFCRARQQVSHGSTSVPQVAVLLSSATQFDRSDDLFHNVDQLTGVEGALQALLESHYSVDVLAEHQLQPRLEEFPLVVVPDAYVLEEEFRQALLRYAEDGGRVLLLGEPCARLFESVLGVHFEGEPEEMAVELRTPVGTARVKGAWQRISPVLARPVSYRYAAADLHAPGEVAATMTSYGTGVVGAVYGPVPTAYFHSHHPALRRFVADLIREFLPQPAVEVEGPPCVDIALRRTAAGQLSVHLLNLANAPRAKHFPTADFVPPVGPVRVRLRTPERPAYVRWVPEGGDPLTWSWDEGVLSVTVPCVEVHGVIVVE